MEISEGNKFCSNCGATVTATPPLKKVVQLRCSNCSGLMTVEEGSLIIACSYCGSKELILESDEVTIEKIRNNTYRDVTLQKLQYEAAKDDRQAEKEKMLAFKKSKFGKVLVFFTILCIIRFMFNVDNPIEYIVMTVFMLLQLIMFAASWLMGSGTIKTKEPHLFGIVAAIAFALFIPITIAGNLADKSYRERLDMERNEQMKLLEEMTAE
jgi:DNA-directed RNA polymerase subunit RPC12/RpoP